MDSLTQWISSGWLMAWWMLIPPAIMVGAFVAIGAMRPPGCDRPDGGESPAE